MQIRFPDVGVGMLYSTKRVKHSIGMCSKGVTPKMAASAFRLNPAQKWYQFQKPSMASGFRVPLLKKVTTPSKKGLSNPTKGFCSHPFEVSRSRSGASLIFWRGLCAEGFWERFPGAALSHHDLRGYQREDPGVVGGQRLLWAQQGSGDGMKWMDGMGLVDG